GGRSEGGGGGEGATRSETPRIAVAAFHVTRDGIAGTFGPTVQTSHRSSESSLTQPCTARRSSVDGEPPRSRPHTGVRASRERTFLLHSLTPPVEWRMCGATACRLPKEAGQQRRWEDRSDDEADATGGGTPGPRGS